MDFEEAEQALVDAHLELDTNTIDRWIYGAVVGAVICILAIALYVAGKMDQSPALLFFIVGLVVIDLGMDYRRKRLMARILQKYQRAVETQGREASEDSADER